MLVFPKYYMYSKIDSILTASRCQSLKMTCRWAVYFSSRYQLDKEVRGFFHSKRMKLESKIKLFSNMCLRCFELSTDQLRCKYYKYTQSWRIEGLIICGSRPWPSSIEICHFAKLRKLSGYLADTPITIKAEASSKADSRPN